MHNEKLLCVVFNKHITRKSSQRKVSARQLCVYEDLFLPSQHCLTHLAEERLAISTQSIHCWRVHL